MTAEAKAALRLTAYARGGGWAAKLRLGELARVLDQIAKTPQVDATGEVRARKDVVVDEEFSDDAAIVRTSDGRGAVLTADVIAPLVDDPEAFGEIAATNAISDVYAMGGEPRWALNLVFFPDDVLPLDVLHAILRGGARACARAGVAIVGGHSVRDADVKYGLSVTGEIALDQVLSNRGGRAGDALILTKALGTGVIGNAIKAGLASDDEIRAATASMTRLNRDALAIARAHGVTACTDVTGFGLCGHLRNILRGSNLSATIRLGALPLLPGALAHAQDKLLPGGSRANRAFLEPMLDLHVAPDDLLLSLACDAQTSGGLLLCIPPARAAACVDELRDADHPASLIGELRAPDGPPMIAVDG